MVLVYHPDHSRNDVEKTPEPTRFWNNLHQVCSKSLRLESQITLKYLGAIKPKGINKIAKTG
jgi:hypothetical protein